MTTNIQLMQAKLDKDHPTVLKNKVGIYLYKIVILAQCPTNFNIKMANHMIVKKYYNQRITAIQMKYKRVRTTPMNLSLLSRTTRKRQKGPVSMSVLSINIRYLVMKIPKITLMRIKRNNHYNVMNQASKIKMSLLIKNWSIMIILSI